jgi:hypothetical protein
MFMKGPVRELVPAGAQTVRVQLPQGRTAGGVKLLSSGAQAPYRLERQALVVEVPSILLHEVIAVDFV